jgi:hypothetical protein
MVMDAMEALDTLIAVLPLAAGGLALLFSRGHPRVRRSTRGEHTPRESREALDEASPPGLAVNS